MKILHLSFVFIIVGGLLTGLTQEKGSVRIAPGEKVCSFISDEGVDVLLPSSLELEKFETVYYPGGTIPRDYISYLVVGDRHETVSMNKILDIDGYRLCQSSYDSAGATVLSVNHDPYGIAFSYLGYFLFAVGGGGGCLLIREADFDRCCAASLCWLCYFFLLIPHIPPRAILGIR